MEYFLTILTLLFGSGSFFSIYNIWKDIKKERIEREKQQKIKDDAQDKKMQAIAFGVQASLRERLIQSYRQAVKEKHMPYEEKESWLNAYSAYHNLGENGVMDSIKDEVMNMPILPPQN